MSGVFVTFSVMLSVFGLFLVAVFLYGPNQEQIYPAFSKVLVGSLYAALCLLGIAAIFYPKKCQRTFMFRPKGSLEGSGGVLLEKVRFRGHHPDCEAFSANRMILGKTVFCAACAGLLVGAVGAVVGTVLYFFVGMVPFIVDARVVLVGYGGMLLGLFQFKFGGFIKLFVNALFVLSSFVTLVGVDRLGASLFMDLFVFGLIVFMLLTRILFSEWNNRRTCAKCENCWLLGRGESAPSSV